MKETKSIIYLFVLILSISSSPAFAQQTIIDLAIKERVLLEEVITVLEKEYGFLFSYKEEDIKDVKITPVSGKRTIALFLTKILQGTEIQFEIVNTDYVILTKSVLSREEDSGSLLCGRIVDSLTQFPLGFANVYIKNSQKGIASLEDGSFQFRAPLSPTDTLIISYIGYQEKRFAAKEFTKQPCREVVLNYLDFGEDFVVVTEYLTDGISLHNNAAFTELQPSRIGPLPGQAEPDVLSTIQFLPGISSSDGTASGISIRGGTPDQNLILWEDIPIYHSAHYFGMISAFNPYIINKVAVYRGGFDVEYGGRISGVVDMKSDDHTLEASSFGAGANFINGYTNGKISLLENKLSLVYSLRRSMSELWRSPTFENITKRIQQGILVQNVDLNKLPKGIRIDDDFDFFDTNVKVAYRISDQDKLSIAGFFGNNNFGGVIYDDKAMQRQSDTLFLENSGLSLSWTHQWSPELSTRLLGLHTDYHYNYGYGIKTEGQNQPDKLGMKNSMIKEQQIHLLNTYTTNGKHEIKMGYQLINYDIAFQVSKKSRENTPLDEREGLQSNLHVIYAAFNSNKEKRFGVDLGLRLSYFQKEEETCYEPRLRFWYNLSTALNLYLNAGKYFQFLSQLYEIEGDNASIKTPVWALAGGKEVPVLDASQYQLGLVFRKKSWLIDVQGYLKNINGQTSLATGFDEDLSSRYHIGTGAIRGLDILVKKRWKNYQSWVSYSLSKTEYRFPTFFDTEFPAPNDQRQVLSWVNLLSLGKWEFSLGWKIASGKPYSSLANYEIRIAPPGSNGTRESIHPLVNAFNSEQLPAEHQLDASVLYTIWPKKEAQWKGVVGLSLYNVYHQRNIYNRAFYINNRPNEPARLEYTDKVNLGFTPNMVVRFEW